MDEVIVFLGRMVEREKKSLRSKIHLEQAIDSLQSYKKLKNELF